ncbi:MAG: hypothetical protein HC817_07575 [Saprospiraceae bacterium]|nr:hypothetical protein [Saprospiraceae bacterium]
MPFSDGKEFINPSHSYSYDLDIFGDRSLFQHLNRTTNFIGKEKLAQTFVSDFDKNEILDRQKAIVELQEMTDWRQQFYAIGLLNPDSREAVERLKRWYVTPVERVSSVLRVLSFALPLAFLAAVVGFILTDDSLYYSLIKLTFGLNVGFVGLYFKKIRTEVATLANLFKTLENYSNLIELIENQGFSSKKLQILRGYLSMKNGEKTSAQILQMSKILGRLSSFENLAGALIANGSFLYHLHSLFALYRWKGKYAGAPPQYLDVIAEFEALNSLANFGFNNPEFTFPIFSDKKILTARQIGHPLLTRKSAFAPI